MLGDNAYTGGADTQYQKPAVFDMFPSCSDKPSSGPPSANHDT